MMFLIKICPLILWNGLTLKNEEIKMAFHSNLYSCISKSDHNSQSQVTINHVLMRRILHFSAESEKFMFDNLYCTSLNSLLPFPFDMLIWKLC
jgi:hypothetical protein